MNTTASRSATVPSIRSRALLTVALVLAATFAANTQASAATNVWYAIPGYSGGTASVNMTWFNKGYASGSGGGQIYLKNNTGADKIYVQFKPNEGGTWNRATQNRTSGGAYYNWSDSFTLNYSGFMFRICRDRIGPDSCGSAVNVRG